MVDRKDIESRSTCAKGIGTSHNSRKDGAGRAECLDGLPVVGSLAEDISAIGGDGARTDGIALQTLRPCDGRPKIQERVHIDLVVEDANSPADDQIAAPFRLIGKAESGRKVIPVRRENGIDPISLDEQSLARDKHREVPVRTVKRPKVFVADAEIQIEIARDLPRILNIQIERVYPDKPFGISHRDRGG